MPNPTDRALAALNTIEKRARTITLLSPHGLRHTAAQEIIAACEELRAMLTEKEGA